MKLEYILLLEAMPLPQCREKSVRLYQLLAEKKMLEASEQLDDIILWAEQNFGMTLEDDSLDEKEKNEQHLHFFKMLYKYQPTLETRCINLFLRSINVSETE